MQWLADDKMKHRVIGLAVLLSIALIFVPAMVKKSSQRLEKNMNIALQLAPKPVFPDVIAVEPQALLQTVKVAHVVIPEVVDNQKVALPTTVQAMSLSGKTMASRSLVQKTPVLASKPVIVPVKPLRRVVVAALSLPKQPKMLVKKGVVAKKPVLVKKVTLIKKAMPVKKVALKTNLFAVQMASFEKQTNAQTLVQTLQKKGFKAAFRKEGNQYRVLVGELSQREQAKTLQKQLVNLTQLTGFVVKVG